MIQDEAQTRLHADFSLLETKKALAGMGPMKAPGPDGFQALFFKRTWKFTGHALHHFAKGVLNGEDFP